MKMDEFAEKVCDAVRASLDGSFYLSVREVVKNNGVVLHGLVIKETGCNICPTIYLESFLEAYEAGMELGEITRRILGIYRRDSLKGRIEMEFFRHFEKVKDRICYKLVSRRDNGRLLEDVPHVDYLDLAICFYYAYKGAELGEGTISIHNSHLEAWGTTAEELYKLAEQNTPELFPYKCESIKDVLRNLEAEEEADEREEFPKDFWWEMKVLSNRKRLWGAACILYPGALGTITKGQNAYILPSSVHETILIPDIMVMTPEPCREKEELRKMVGEINRTQLETQEVLSDNVYYYDAASDTQVGSIHDKIILVKPIRASSFLKNPG